MGANDEKERETMVWKIVVVRCLCKEYAMIESSVQEEDLSFSILQGGHFLMTVKSMV